MLCGVASAAAQEESAAPPPATKPAAVPPSGTVDSTYKLGPGDKVTINVFNQEDLSGEYTLDGDGRFSMPLIGTVDANGLTPLELEALLVGRFKPDYLVNPRIFIQVGNYRPYYLMGEVAGTGAFPYQPGMTYLTAIANAGGFTYRAKQDHVFVIRGDDPEQKEIKLSVDENPASHSDRFEVLLPPDGPRSSDDPPVAPVRHAREEHVERLRVKAAQGSSRGGASSRKPRPPPTSRRF